VKLGFVAKKGMMPLTLEGENGRGPDERVLELTQSEERFVFVDVEEEPLLSIGRGFSAPVHFRSPVDHRARAQLMSRDSDDFNRWESGQTLATDVLTEMANAIAKGANASIDGNYTDAIGAVIDRASDDPAFAALMLSPPLESELALAMSPPDPDAIHRARVSLIRHLATRYAPKLQALYRSLEQGTQFSPDAASAGKRALRNIALRYLTAADDDAAAGLADAHYRSASNMTDMVAGLAALSRMNSPKRDTAFADFHDRFRSDPLVLDKWMSLQAGSPLPGTANAVRALMKHRAFDMANPNRVRSLVGAFAANHLRFHAGDGSGYALLGETICALDKINPQVAGRMAGCFEAWRRYDPARQTLMRTQLTAMTKIDGLSPNLFEVATKMLG
jgi:aminopeptidase N